MASKFMTCSALLLLAMTLVVAVQSASPMPSWMQGHHRPHRVEKAVDYQTIPCPLSCKGNIRVFPGIDVQDMERWRERILKAIDLQGILNNGLREVDPVIRVAADVADNVAEKKKA